MTNRPDNTAKPYVKPIGLIFVIDILLTASSFLASYFICTSIWPELQVQGIVIQLPIIIAITSLIFLLIGSKKGLVKYDRPKEVYSIFNAICLSNILTIVLVVIHGKLTNNEVTSFLIPASIIVVHSILSFIALIASRYLFTTLHGKTSETTKAETYERIVLSGPGESMQELIKAYERFNQKDLVVGFVNLDTNYLVHTSADHSLPQCKLTNKALKDLNISRLIITENGILSTHSQKFIKRILSLPFKVEVAKIVLYPLGDERELEISEIHNLQIEELYLQDDYFLEPLNQTNSSYYDAKRILILGGAGCVGKEILKKLINFKFCEILLIDKSDDSLFHLEQELSEQKNIRIQTLMADILDGGRMRQVFIDFSPNLVVNAAGYKIFDFTKDNLYEALRLNILANKLVADLAIEFKVQKYVNLSRNFPIKFCTYARATERIGEIYLNCLNTQSSTDFINIRFGNVMESSSSALNLFKAQLAKGGPIKVSSKEALISFISVSKLAKAIIKVIAIGKGGEIFTIETNHTVTEYSLAEQLIKTSQYKKFGDINIIVADDPNLEEPLCKLISKEVTSTKFNTINNLNFLKEEYSDSERLLSKIDKLCAANMLFNKKIVTTLMDDILKHTQKPSRSKGIDHLVSNEVLEKKSSSSVVI